MTVRRIMAGKATQEVVTIAPDASILEAAQLLAQRRIGAVIVSADGKRVDGILSERDIVRALGTAGIESTGKTVRDLMTGTVIACKPDDSSHHIMEKMTGGRFRHMPVVEEGRLIGVISIGDVVKARMTEIEHENSALTDMIVGHG